MRTRTTHRVYEVEGYKPGEFDSEADRVFVPTRIGGEDLALGMVRSHGYVWTILSEHRVLGGQLTRKIILGLLNRRQFSREAKEIARYASAAAPDGL